MRIAPSRLLLGLLPLAGLVVAVATVGGQVPVVPPVAPKPPEKKEKTQSLEAMTFPSDRNARQMIQAVKDYLEEHKGKDNAPWDKICFAAQQVLDEKGDSFFEVTRKDDDTGKVQRVSAKAEVNRLIGSLPAAGRQFYQLTYGPPAEAALAAAQKNNHDRTALAEVSQRYFHTKAGAQATLLLAGLHLDRGNYIEAAYSFERLLARPESDDLWTPRTAFKALVAFKRAGSGPPDITKKLTTLLESKFPRDGLAIGRRTYSLDELRDELDRPVESLFGKVGDAYVTMRLGNASHTAVADGGRPFLDPGFRLSTLSRPRDPADDAEDQSAAGGQWTRQNLEQVLRGISPAKGEAAVPGFFPVTAQNLILCRTYDGVFAVAARTGTAGGVPAKAGDVVWVAPTKGNLNELAGGPDQGTLTRWWEYYRDTANVRGLLFDNGLVGSMTHDGQTAYLIDDAAVPQPPPQVAPEFGGINPNAVTAPPTATLFERGSQLVAVDIATGRQAWAALGQLFTDGAEPALTEEEEDKQTNPYLLTSGAYFLGPPLPVNGKLYVLFEKHGRIRLACLDPNRLTAYPVPPSPDPNRPRPAQFVGPELVWTQRLGEPNVRLPADAYRRFQCAYLGYADGVMVCPTNAGAVVAVDVMSRSLLWARSYRVQKGSAAGENGMPAQRIMIRRLGGAMPGEQGNASPLAQDRWRAAAPIVANGRVVFAAYDSDALDCLDLRTGGLLWSVPRRPGDLYVGGLVGDKVLIVGKETVRAVNLVGKPRPAAGPSGSEEAVSGWERDIRIGVPAGHGVASKGGVYYLPLAVTPDAPTPAVWAIDTVKGEVQAKTAYRLNDQTDARPLLGNLVFHEGQLFAQTPTELVAFPLLDVKKREMDERLKANPADPTGLLARGELLLDDGRYAPAVADLKAADKAGVPTDLRPRLRDKLYLAYTELLRRDFAAGEGFLAEYRQLLDVPADTDDPNRIQKIMDERVRRKALFLVLLARGRERQGRLAEAFDLYREFAALGDNKQLVSIEDEPVGQTLPAVWARARIETMLRDAKDPAARKPLEDRVAKEWTSVRGAKDLDKLREFVRVFGPHFAVGREAQLELADRLAGTRNEDDAREAQAVLLRLWATGEDRPTTAKAIDALARLMTRRGLLDDAVALYTQLGTEYADVPVRAGKTGADLLTDLLTDKRLLPHLEPTRSPAPARVKAVEKPQASAATPGDLAFDPDGGETSPFFRRHRLALVNAEQTPAGATSALKVTDRLTGQEVWRHGDLRVFAPGGRSPTQYRLAQASGHLLLLHLGNTVYCLDMAERRRLWDYNVLGAAPRVDPNAMQAEDGADGELLVTYSADGSRLRLGRSALLTPAAAALVTHEGLVALDPLTGTVLWKRADVAPSSLVFGDARHLFVVETLSDGKARSRVLRATDGAAVPNVPDFGPRVAEAGRLRLVGRLVLSTDGGKSRERTLELYDPLAGKPVWTKTYPAGSFVLKTTAPELTGVLNADGAFEVLDVKTGASVFAGKLDPTRAADHMRSLGEPLLLADADRFYLFLNREEKQNRLFQRRFTSMGYGYASMRSLPVNGPVYGFDRAGKAPVWFTDTLFDGQQLVVERFAELPALLAVTQVQDPDANYGTNRVIVLDKANGKLRYLKQHPQNNLYFFAVAADPATGGGRLVGNALTIEISPDDAPRAAAR